MTPIRYIFLVASLFFVAVTSAKLKVLDEQNWDQMLTGEWMVELWVLSSSFVYLQIYDDCLECRLFWLTKKLHNYLVFLAVQQIASIVVLFFSLILFLFFISYAPWCPACRALEPVWKDFATWSDDLGIKVGHVDVTMSPGLSGRFMVTALPTIYQ